MLSLPYLFNFDIETFWRIWTVLLETLDLFFLWSLTVYGFMQKPWFFISDSVIKISKGKEELTNLEFPKSRFCAENVVNCISLSEIIQITAVFSKKFVQWFENFKVTFQGDVHKTLVNRARKFKMPLEHFEKDCGYYV